MDDKTPLFLKGMTDTALKIEKEGYQHESLSELARKLVIRFCRDNGGEILRVPTLKAIDKRERDAAIRADVKVMTVSEVAEKHGVTCRTVYGVLSD